MDEYKVSIIIPVYNVAQYIEKCIESVFYQSYKNIEIIFVDDNSPDNSIKIIEDYVSRNNLQYFDYKIIHHTINKGLASARLTGILESSGDYIYHIDSDDWIENNAIELFVNKAQETYSDIVVSNMILEFPKFSIKKYTPTIDNKIEYIKNILLRNDKYPWNQVNTLIRKEIALDNLPVEGINMGEDWITFPRLLWRAKRISNLDIHTYHYRQSNITSYTNTLSNKSFCDLINGSDFILTFFAKEDPINFNSNIVDISRIKLRSSLMFYRSKELRRNASKIIKVKKNTFLTNFKFLGLNDYVMFILSSLSLWRVIDKYVKYGLLIKNFLRH